MGPPLLLLLSGELVPGEPDGHGPPREREVPLGDPGQVQTRAGTRGADGTSTLASSGGVRELHGEADDRHEVHPLQHSLQEDPGHLDLLRLHDLAGDPLQQEAGPHLVRAGRGLAYLQRCGHLSLHVGQTQADEAQPVAGYPYAHAAYTYGVPTVAATHVVAKRSADAEPEA